LPRVVGQPRLVPAPPRAPRATLHFLPMESTIIAAFRRGDTGGVRDVYRAYGHLVYVVSFRVLGRSDLAEEATQETFVRAWQSAAGNDMHVDLAPWFARIAKRTAIEVYRREARVAPVAAARHDDRRLVSLPPDVDTLDAAWKLRRAIDALPSQESAVVRLQHLNGMLQDEIAIELGIPVDTVRSRSHRAHGRLAMLLGQLREPVG
jgi:RNA polymerase sigma factor (sigma-70 family)